MQNQNVIAIYSRKSRFTGKGESVGNQVELCRAYIRTAFGDALADGAVVYEDEGFSGGNLHRPGFQRMMAAARRRQFRAVVVYRLDRISRNISDFAALIQELSRLDIAFVSLREQFDTSSPMGRAMMYIASVFSQLERETIAERIRDNLHELAKTGRWLGGTTPTGYTSEAVKTVTVDGKSKRACKLRLIPREAAVVRLIYDLYRETDSLSGTEAELLRRQVRTKTGHSFTRFSVRAILQNPVYLIADRDAWQYFQQRQAEVFSAPEDFDGVRGMLAYHRTDQEKGKATVYRPVSQWIVSVGQHPGIIPASTWIAVQESLERNKSGACRKSRGNEALLTGLLWCGCGSRMYPKLSRRRENAPPAYRYVCKMKERSRGALCSCPNAAGNLLDGAVVARVRELNGGTDALLTMLEKAGRLCTGRRAAEEGALADLRQQQADTQRSICALVDSLADFDGSDAAVHVRERLEALHARAEELEARIREQEGQSARSALDDQTFERLRQRLAAFGECIDGMTVEQKRATLRATVRRVVWDGQCARVELWGAADPTSWGEDSK